SRSRAASTPRSRAGRLSPPRWLVPRPPRPSAARLRRLTAPTEGARATSTVPLLRSPPGIHSRTTSGSRGPPNPPSRVPTRMAERRDVYRRRRLAALGVVALVSAFAGAAVGASAGDPGSSGASAGTAPAKAAKQTPPKPAELPLGGRTIFPH